MQGVRGGSFLHGIRVQHACEPTLILSQRQPHVSWQPTERRVRGRESKPFRSAAPLPKQRRTWRQADLTIQWRRGTFENIRKGRTELARSGFCSKCWHVCRYENFRSFCGSTSLSSFTRLGAPSGTLTTFQRPACTRGSTVSAVSNQRRSQARQWSNFQSSSRATPAKRAPEPHLVARHLVQLALDDDQLADVLDAEAVLRRAVSLPLPAPHLPRVVAGAARHIVMPKQDLLAALLLREVLPCAAAQASTPLSGGIVFVARQK